MATYGQKVVAEGDQLADEVSSLCARLTAARAAALLAEPQGGCWAEVVAHLESVQDIIQGGGPGGDLSVFTRRRNPWILRALLGSSTNVVAPRKEQSLRLKEEYHTFRNKSAYTMFAFSLALQLAMMRARVLQEAQGTLTFTPVIIVGIQLFLVWLLYFYTAAALRESVLMVNGSHIRPWWIHHHYWSVATSALMLSLPVDSPAFVRAVTVFVWWAMLQAAVIIVQNRYQRRRMYTRIAMGKTCSLDVVCGESSGAHGQLLLLYPLLFSLQALQSYIGTEMIVGTYWAVLSTEGYTDFERKDTDLWGSRGVFLAGLMMMYMGAMNFSNTIATIARKKALKLKKAQPSSGVLAHSGSGPAVGATLPGKGGGKAA